MLYRDLTYTIIGAAMEVHQVLGPGFLESVYEESLAHEFYTRGLYLLNIPGRCDLPGRYLQRTPGRSQPSWKVFPDLLRRYRGLAYERQAVLRVRYKEIVAGQFRADFLVDQQVIVELKATKRLTSIDDAQLLNYLKGTGYRVGLLLNFGTTSLEHRRRIV